MFDNFTAFVKFQFLTTLSLTDVSEEPTDSQMLVYVHQNLLLHITEAGVFVL